MRRVHDTVSTRLPELRVGGAVGVCVKIPWTSARVQRDLRRLSNRDFVAKWKVSISAASKWRRTLRIPSPGVRKGGTSPTSLPADFEDRWKEMSYRELAAHYGISVSTVTAWRASVGVPGRRAAGVLRWREVLAWAQEHGATVCVLAHLLDVSPLRVRSAASREGVRLVDGRTNKGKRKGLRTLAYCVLRACGWTWEEIATAFEVSRQSVHQLATRAQALSEAPRT